MSIDAVLIFTPIDFRYQDALTHYAPSLGLVAIENYLFSKGISVNIIDGSVVYTMEEILRWLRENKPMYVGQSIQLISYNNALNIAKVVHEYGGVNVLGGHHATQMANAILHNQGDLIDYIIVGDGEVAWHELLSGKPIQSIPNLSYNKNNRTFHNEFVELDLNSLPVLDYSRIDLSPYQKRLQDSAFVGGAYHNYLRFYSHKGCGNRVGGRGCVFCGRADRRVRFKNPSLYWQDIRHCVNEAGADFIFDVGDDFLYSNQYLSEIISAKPSDLMPYDMGIFGRANRVSPFSAHALREIGVVDVTIGFESGDEVVLKNCNKMFASPEQNLKAAEYLVSEGIDITASYVLGMPGETRESLRNTVRNARQLVDIVKRAYGRPPKELVANLLEPSPGSPIYWSLVKAYPDQYELNDKLDLETMQRDYFKLYFGIDTLEKYRSFRHLLRETALEIHSYVSFSDAQGWLSDE